MAENAATALASAIAALTQARETEQLVQRLRQAQQRAGPLTTDRALATAAAALPLLDPREHALGVCFVLEAQARALAPPPPPPPAAAAQRGGGDGGTQPQPPGNDDDEEEQGGGAGGGDHPMGGDGGEGGAAAAAPAVVGADAGTLLLGGPAAPPTQPLTAQARAFVEFTSRFLRECPADQIRAAPDVFASLCRNYKAILAAAGFPRLGVAPLTAAAFKLQPRAGVLTPAHADCLQLAILARTYSAVAPLVDEDVLEVDPRATGSTALDLLLYGYYAGTVAAARRRFARASELFSLAATAPLGAGPPSAIALAAYKRYVLTTLIAAPLPANEGGSGGKRGGGDRAGAGGGGSGNGGGGSGDGAGGNGAGASASVVITTRQAIAALPFPRHVPPRLRNLVEGPEGRAYAEIAAAHAAGGGASLARALSRHAAALASDGNAPLADVLLRADAACRSVQRLTRTYAALPLAEAARSAGLQAEQGGGGGATTAAAPATPALAAALAERAVRACVSAGLVRARIDAVAGVVHFPEDSPGGGCAGGGSTAATTGGAALRAAALAAGGGAAVARAFDRAIAAAARLAERLGAAHDAVSTDRAFLGRGIFGGGGGGGMGGGYGARSAIAAMAAGGLMMGGGGDDDDDEEDDDGGAGGGGGPGGGFGGSAGAVNDEGGVAAMG